MRRFLLGNRIWSNNFCNSYVCIFIYLLAIKPFLVQFFNEVDCEPEISFEEGFQICFWKWLLKISMLVFVSFLSPDFYHLHKAFTSNNRVTVAGRITREKVVTCLLSVFFTQQWWDILWILELVCQQGLWIKLWCCTFLISKSQKNPKPREHWKIEMKPVQMTFSLLSGSWVTWISLSVILL